MNNITIAYIKNPVKVQAIRFTDQNKDQVFNWTCSIQGNVTHGWDENNQPILRIPTLEGKMVCSLGDYLIMEPFPTDWRKLYPCKSEIFEKTYSKVERKKNMWGADEKDCDDFFDKITKNAGPRD